MEDSLVLVALTLFGIARMGFCFYKHSTLKKKSQTSKQILLKSTIMKVVTLQIIKAAAVNLIDKDTPSEYSRGICELIAEIDGKENVPHDQRSEEIATELGISSDVINKLW